MSDFPMSCYLSKQHREKDMENSGWIKYDGMGYPGFATGTKLMVRYRDGGEEPKTIRNHWPNHENIVWGWDHNVPGPDEIIAYKVVS